MLTTLHILYGSANMLTTLHITGLQTLAICDAIDVRGLADIRTAERPRIHFCVGQGEIVQSRAVHCSVQSVCFP